MGRDSSVGIATRYGLDGRGIESLWGGGDFPQPFEPATGAHPNSYTMGTGSFSGVKRPERGVDHPSSAEVNERVELYLYSPPWVFVACFPLPSHLNRTHVHNAQFSLLNVMVHILTTVVLRFVNVSIESTLSALLTESLKQTHK